MINWGYAFGTTDTSIIFVNKQQPDAKTNLERIKSQIALLPKYLQFEYIEDEETGKILKGVNNATRMTHAVNKNQIVIKAGSASPDKAVSLARGLTAPIIHYDEVEFTPHVREIIDNSVSTYETAARASKENGSLYGRIFTSTPGDKDSEPGQSSEEVLVNCKQFTDRMFDMDDDYLHDYANAGSNGIVYIEYQYYQIGLDNEWLENIHKKYTNQLTFRREILLQRLHGSSLSPYPQEDIEYINERKQLPTTSIFLKNYYEMTLYVEALNPEVPYIVGIDCSTGTNKDHNAITVINPYTQRPEAELECNYIGETMYEEVIKELVLMYIPRAIVCIERNSVGDGIVDHLLHSRIAGRLYYDKNRDLVDLKMDGNSTVESMLRKEASKKSFYGVYTEGESRKDMFAILADRIVKNKEDFVTVNITRDISNLVQTASGKIEARKGVHDDSVMSYLIGMYILIHCNNLPLFGYIPGEKKDVPKNKGMSSYSEAQLKEILPDDVAKAIVEAEEQARKNDYEAILREAMYQSQVDTARKLKNKNLHYESDVEVEEYSVYDDTYGDTSVEDLSLFDSLNGIGSYQQNTPNYDPYGYSSTPFNGGNNLFNF